ncbi:hypothetical protein [Paenibacillus wenxiniae]|uniref:Uncharacterized protein n=1 Tax=Paenibacillus wenxiniae TaxID=1636843 RepID=A0ABW4RDC3_9BACL
MTINYGIIKFEGDTYILKGKPQPTGATLNRNVYTNYNDAEEGEKYDFEMSAPVIDNEGVEWTMFWVFQDIKGKENSSYDSFDYNKVFCVMN